MADTSAGHWEQIRARTLEAPEGRARYERTKGQVVATRRILQQIDEERERRGMTKADLAHRIGAAPSVVRRLFSSETSNPTLATIVAMLDALDLGVQVQRSRLRRRSQNPLTKDHLKAQGKTVLLTTNYLEEANTLCDRLAIAATGDSSHGAWASV